MTDWVRLITYQNFQNAVGEPLDVNFSTEGQGYSVDGSRGQFKISPPSFIREPVDKFNSVIDLLIFGLDVALTALDFAKAWLIEFTDPLTILLQQVIQAFQEILEGFISAGLYFTSDMLFVEENLQNLRGGFESYKQRMVNRFLDSTDPTRPIIPESSEVLAVFFYNSANIHQVEQLFNFLGQIFKFFTIQIPEKIVMNTPNSLSVEYYSSTNALFQGLEVLSEIGFNRDLGQNDRALIKWKVPQTEKIPLGLPVPPPSGFIVSVSTFNKGISLVYDRPLPDAPSQESDNTGEKVEQRETGNVLDENGNPIVLYGGYDLIEIDTSMDYNNATDSDKNAKPGVTRIFGNITPTDQIPIVPSTLKENNNYFYQKSFYVPYLEATGLGSSFAPGAFIGVDIANNPTLFAHLLEYSHSLRKEDMPLMADFEYDNDGRIKRIGDGNIANSFYVRIASVSENIKSVEDARVRLIPQNSIPGKGVLAKYGINAKGDQVTNLDISAFSRPIKISFPNATDETLENLLTTALIILVLTRVDLPVPSLSNSADSVPKYTAGYGGRETGLERYSYLLQQILEKPVEEYFKSEMATPTTFKERIIPFRLDLITKCRNKAREMLKGKEIEVVIAETLISQTSILTDFRWSQIEEVYDGISTRNYNFPDETILQSVESTARDTGICKSPKDSEIFNVNPLSIYLTELKAISPGYLKRSDGYISIEDVPVLKVTNSQNLRDKKLLCIRSIIPNNVYGAAGLVLAVLSENPKGEEKGYWYNRRLRDAFPELITFLESLLSLSRGLLFTTSSIVGAILEYIDFLQSRILELQKLLRRLKILLDFNFEVILPSFDGLVITGKGTTGVLNEFLRATNEPNDSDPNTYGGGSCVVLGGLPTIIKEFFLSVFSSVFS